jgi:hypothetical protein
MEDIVFSSIATVFQLGSSEKHCIDISVKVLDNRYFYVVKAIDRKDIWEKIIIVKNPRFDKDRFGSNSLSRESYTHCFQTKQAMYYLSLIHISEPTRPY